MSRKSKKRRARNRKAAGHPKFTLGTQVRVKNGTTDPDFPDIPLGGWSGTISDVDDRSNPPTYLIDWNKRTLAAMHPVYRKRCERDGLEPESMWLGEQDIEPDTGEPVAIERPTQIIVRPLQMSDQDDRIRAIFGLTSDDPLPPVDDEHLRKYHEHLAHNLTFPFSASYSEEVGFMQDRRHRIMVTVLLDADDSDDDDGLLCEAQEGEEKVVLPLSKIEKVGGPNCQRVEDYGYWFVNWQGEGAVGSRWIEQAIRPHEIDERTDNKPPITRGLATALSKISLLGALHGAGIGAALASLDGALMAAKIGAVVLGSIFGWFGLKDGHRNRYWFGGIVGLFLGGVLGVTLGIMLVAFIGTLIGAVFGGMLWWYLGSGNSKPGRTMLGAMAGAMLGIGVQSWLHSSQESLSGALTGGLIGAFAGPVLFISMVFASAIFSIRQERR